MKYFRKGRFQKSIKDIIVDTMASADVDWAGAADAQEKALRQMDRQHDLNI